MGYSAVFQWVYFKLMLNYKDPLKNATREFPITFIFVQLLLQKYFISEIQHLDWCHHF